MAERLAELFFVLLRFRAGTLKTLGAQTNSSSRMSYQAHCYDLLVALSDAKTVVNQQDATRPFEFNQGLFDRSTEAKI